MDKNQIIGIILIAIILIGYTMYTAPSEEEIAAAKHRRDSILQVQKKLEQEQARKLLEQQSNNSSNSPSFAAQDSTLSDSARKLKMQEKFAQFGNAAVGENQFISIENDLIKLTLSTKGGRPYSVQLKKYQTHDSLPLILFDGAENQFGMTFFANNRKIATNDLFFTNISGQKNIKVVNQGKSVRLQLKTNNGNYIEYKYSLKPNSYLVDFDINFVGMNKVISRTNSYIDFNWYDNMPSLEKGKQWENQYSGIYYKHYRDEVEYLTETSSGEENINTKIKWIAFKQQFFASVLIAKDAFLNAKLKQILDETHHDYLKQCSALIGIPFDGKDKETFSLSMYYGPSQYKVLNNIHVAGDDDLKLRKLIPLGWGIFGWINRFAIIPLFNFLGSFISNYGMLILVMTIIIKLVLFPLTFKSYQSSAKMRVLKPQIDAINEKIPKEKAMERQQATMALYRKAGVNPMGGCLPMLIQFPILLAMYKFFPASIELRQKAFLWANDLSSYDSIVSWTADIPLVTSMYGNHVSLFTLLMAISLVISTKINGSQMQSSNSQMPGMQTMMYLMPVMMLIWFNKYSSGLSYYYFLSNLITIGQTLAIRKFIDDEAVLQKLNENKKKPKKKSKLLSRLEEYEKQNRKMQQNKRRR